jgi:hypothetical protein
MKAALTAFVKKMLTISALIGFLADFPWKCLFILGYKMLEHLDHCTARK